MKRIIFSLFPIFLFYFLISSSWINTPKWKDTRALYKKGRVKVVNEALVGLINLGLIDENYWNENIDKLQYVYESNNCKKDEADATFKHSYRSYYTYENGRKVKFEDCVNRITINSNIFELGYYVFDVEGKYLNSRNRNDIEFRWAKSLKEAVMYLLLHEYTHARGYRDHTMVDMYVNGQILEIRKYQSGMSYEFGYLTEDKMECRKFDKEVVMSIRHPRIKPPYN